MSVLDFLTMFGGLAFFLYGMSVMSSSLEKMAGGKLEGTLRKATANPLLGAGITIAVQSSSALTVMLVGLVNSGIMDFSQTIGVIFGSNVGTTLTSWILSLMGLSGDEFSLLSLFSPTYFSPIFAFIGIVLRMFAKSDRKREVGTMMIGFAVLMYGMSFMSDSVSAIKEMNNFEQFISLFNNPLTAVLVSTVFTGIIQSSAATVGIVQILAGTGVITYQMAIPLVLGANIGTCMTALLSCIGVNRAAKRVSIVHIYIKIIGTVLWLLLMAVCKPFTGSLMQTHVSEFTVAMIHTVFNVMNTLVLFPCVKLLVKLTYKTLPDKKDKQEKTVFLDERLLLTPQMAMEECRRLTAEMADLSREAIFASIDLLNRYDSELAQRVADMETMTDRYEDKLGTFLVRLSGTDLSDADSHAVGRMLHTIGDLERLGDHAENISNVARELFEKKIQFSRYATNEVETITAAVKEIVNMTIDAYKSDDREASSHVEPLEQVIDGLKKELLARHVERVQKGGCTVEMGFVFSDLITNYERISDHCSNIAVYTMQMHSVKLDTHKYLRGIKGGENQAFLDDFALYEKKYELAAEE